MSVLSTIHDDTPVPVERRSRRAPGGRETVEKPRAVVEYIQVHGWCCISSAWTVWELFSAYKNNYLRVERQTLLCCHQHSRQPSPYRAMRSHTLIWSVKSPSRNTSIRTCNLSQKDPSRTEDPGYLARALALRPR